MYYRAELNISLELRMDCVDLFKQCPEEFDSAARLRSFARFYQLELTDKWFPKTEELIYEEVFLNLLRYGRSWSEPVLLSLLSALALKYSDDWRKDKCRELGDKIRSELLQGKTQEQEGNVLQLVKDSTAVNGRGGKKSAESWIEEAGDNLDELALRISLAVFQGTTFETIEAAKDDLFEMLKEFVPPPPPPDPEAPPVPPPPHVPLMRRIQMAGAFETEAKPPDWERVVELKEPVAGEVITYVWHFYKESKWRQKFMEWLTIYAAGHRADVRARAAVAVGILATNDYRFVRDRLLSIWVKANVNRSQYRTAIGIALVTLVQKEGRAEEVQSLLRNWSRSPNPAERWAALRAYIYVGAYCRPVKEVIAGWRDIAAFAVAASSESVPILIDGPGLGDAEIRVVELKPMLMSLMDAMMRFFVGVAQMPADEKAPRFVSILEGLKEWIADNRTDARLGLFMFTTLGQLVVGAADDGEPSGAPVLLQLLAEGPDENGYRSQLAGLFELLMRKADTIIDAKDLLCAWLGWANSVQGESPSYESRIRSLFEEIIAADRSGRARGKLAAFLRDCGRNRVAQSLLSGL
jgi:hypothetical protein